MSKVITCATNKGGEGKTTLSIMLAEYLTIVEKKKVLLIDMDPQANLSGRYLNMEIDPNDRDGKRPPIHPESEEGEEERSSISDLFFGKPIYPYPTPFKNLEIIPGSRVLEDIRSSFENTNRKDVASALKKFLSLEELNEEYDFVVIDTPPSKCVLTKAALKSTDFMIVPAKMEQFSMEGIYGMLQLYSQEQFERKEDCPIHFLGIVPNMIRNVSLHKENLESFRKHKVISKYLLPIELKMRVTYPEMLADDADPSSIFELPARNDVRKETQELCKLCYTRIKSFSKSIEGITL